MFDTLLKYLSQQSTWKGILSLLTAVGITISPDMATAIIAVFMAIVGLLNVFRNEKKAVVTTVQEAGVTVPNPELK